MVDPTLEEETCSNSSVVVAVTESGLITSVFKTGVGSFHPQTLEETLKVIGRILFLQTFHLFYTNIQTTNIKGKPGKLK